ncbi:MAG: hypothetical protein A2712_07535 [Deltaproteobacteria bacterium RIFCSPHIGHO2_01_FULL_43_49]|nr:MAG: hypothetical protein A2712_07535 [Deltaproteobacteria bacterium RIFCSPHIGHO2_01_FULL_43_49]OGQ14805.1 MAG: hypothetical protein A3D22_09460 [Deltaproteobacteria bacterium RIFCSPHIGHO2_02_FULL_44_53]
MARQLNLDRDKLDSCYELAAQIVSHTAKYLDRHSSSSIERTTLTLLGVEGEHRGIPFASLMVEKLSKDQLRLGVAHWWTRALLATAEEPKKLAEQLARGKLKWNDLKEMPPSEIRKKAQQLAEENLQKLDQSKSLPIQSIFYQRMLKPPVAFYHDDVKTRRLLGALHDVKKKGAAFCVTKVSSKEFLKEVYETHFLKSFWQEAKEFPMVVTTQGLSVPEQTLMALQLGFRAIALDGLNNSLAGEVGLKRSLVDLNFSLILCARLSAKIVSRYLPRFNPSQMFSNFLLYEQFARRHEISFENIVLSSGQTQDNKEREFVSAFGFSQLLREAFSQSPIWYRLSIGADPFNFWIAGLTGQDCLLIDAMADGQLKQALHYTKQLEGLGDEVSFNTHGKIAREAHFILDQTWKFLKQIQQKTLWKAFEEGLLTMTPSPVVNLGEEGVFQKSYHYLNPVWELLEKQLKDLRT